MKDILVFAHMMKTAGTSLSKQLIAHFGKRMHIVPGGLKMDHDYYGKQDFQKDLKKLNYKLDMITGHPMRPYIDFGEHEKNMSWFTFFRDPGKRYVSHYLHDYKWSNHFSYKRYRSMKNSSIVEWEKIENISNYQTKFIAGEDNFDKAVEVLENKIKWVGLTEEYEESLHSFKSFFGLDDFCFEINVTNSNLAKDEMKEKVWEDYSDFIYDKNETDIRLYKYVKENIWPKFRIENFHKPQNVKGKNVITRKVNTVLFHLNRQLKFGTSEINYQNIKRFYKRWYR